MTALPSALTKTNYDQTTDDPKAARSELATNTDSVNTILSYLTGLFGTDGVPATARGALGLTDIAAAALGHGVEIDTGALRVKLDGASLARGSSGIKVADEGVDLDQMADGASGDMIYYGTGGRPFRLAKGTDGEILTLVSGLPSWEAVSNASVEQGDITTSTGTISVQVPAVGGGSSQLARIGDVTTLPGGTYGWFPQSRNGSIQPSDTFGWFTGWLMVNTSSSYVTAVAPVNFKTNTSASNGATTQQQQQRYVSASPPFDMGDGDAGGFFFFLMDEQNEIIGHYLADVPPWAYNGPTNIRADWRCTKTKRKFREVHEQLTTEQILDGVKPKKKFELITHKIKNADMNLIPTPWPDLQPGRKVVMIDAMSDHVRNLVDAQNKGPSYVEQIMDEIKNGRFKPDSEKLNRSGPKGVRQVRLKIR